MKANTYLIITQYLRSRTSNHRPYVTLTCEHGGAIKPRTKLRVDNKEEEVPIKRRGPYGTKKCGCPFKLKSEQMATKYGLCREKMYNMLLLEVVGMTPTGKDFTVVITFMHNEQATTYRWVLKQIKHLYFSSSIHVNQNVLAKLTEMIKDEEVASRVWTSQVLHFEVETTDHVESEHSVLKLWLSTYHGNLDIVFLNIDSLLESQIVEIKSSLEFSRLKEKFNAKSNHILKNISNNISHLALKKI
ncbi:hypothetical protein M9H77_17861 [Catharanthus roseus]|uniref:Uncharacterized protein n=1 Tax=Catharanthus roseus TaxID=4058 RepID=A0ACC0B5V1_CATRO|nr:hypothetical protein M9H77_17861 [Catharanthus roseus]